MNDRKLFLMYFDVARHSRDTDTIAFAMQWCQHFVDKNQNPPPHGGADGSFTVEQWTASRDALKRLRELNEAAGRM